MTYRVTRRLLLDIPEDYEQRCLICDSPWQLQLTIDPLQLHSSMPQALACVGICPVHGEQPALAMHKAARFVREQICSSIALAEQEEQSEAAGEATGEAAGEAGEIETAVTKVTDAALRAFGPRPVVAVAKEICSILKDRTPLLITVLSEQDELTIERTCRYASARELLLLLSADLSSIRGRKKEAGEGGGLPMHLARSRAIQRIRRELRLHLLVLGANEPRNLLAGGAYAPSFDELYTKRERLKKLLLQNEENENEHREKE